MSITGGPWAPKLLTDPKKQKPNNHQRIGFFMQGRELVIDEERCDGCGLCVDACHEGALALIDGKAKLVRKDFCDGLGDCLPACPRNAISFRNPPLTSSPGIPIACPSSEMMSPSDHQWPIQLALVPPRSPWFKGTVVFAADCTAFMLEDIKKRYLEGNAVIIGCPKLDDRTRFTKVAEILQNNPIEKVLVIRMEVPCCKALTNVVTESLKNCGKEIPFEEIVIGRDGRVIS